MPNTCPQCKVPYDDTVPLNPVLGTISTPPICGICALKVVSEIHGVPLKSFHGEMAEEARQAALAWRRKHPRYGGSSGR